MRFFLEISYNGTAYHGWQVQENAHSVQQEVENVLSQLFSGKRIETLGCGRTDTGVHARQFFLHFDLDELPFEENDFVFKLNRMLPRDIAAHHLFRVKDDAHARYDATSRSYEYHIHFRKDPFRESFSFYTPYTVDVERMNEAAGKLLTYNDFSSFCKHHTDTKTMICNVSEARWEQTKNGLVFHITADRFLRNMVRAITGTLMLAGKGVISTGEFCRIIEKKDRGSAGESMPACGLYLTNVTYPYLRNEL
ncbi:MAG: tRNA pseudouridine(38-40) synthase TruA [Bacteroidota bacterium]